MKNILLKSLHKIRQPEQTLGPFKVDLSKFDAYRRMQDISVESFEKNLLGDWELVEICEEFDSIQDSFIYTMQYTHDLWQSGNCNILYADPDVCCFAPTRVFDANFISCCNGNCGVRYFPASMRPELWHTAIEFVKHWNHDDWSYEQDIYSLILTTLKTDPSQMWITEIVEDSKIDTHNDRVAKTGISQFVFEIKKNNKSMVHFHATRGISKTLAAMEQLHQWCNNQ